MDYGIFIERVVEVSELCSLLANYKGATLCLASNDGGNSYGVEVYYNENANTITLA